MHNNFPRFSVTHIESETEEELLTRIKTQGAELIESLSRIDPKRTNENCTIEGQTDSMICSVKRDGKKRERPPPLTDSEASEDEDEESNLASHLATEADCRSCSFHIELPIQMEDSNQIIINRESGEVFIYPRDEAKDEE